MQRYVAADVTLRPWQRNVRDIKTQRHVSPDVTLRCFLERRWLLRLFIGEFFVYAMPYTSHDKILINEIAEEAVGSTLWYT